jgi:glycosyltransferase involved in cell wall biosynthesis
LDVKVYYTWSQVQDGLIYDPSFKKNIKWDIPLLEGYEFEFVENESANPGSHHFNGIINSKLIPRINAFNPDGILIYGWSFKSHLQAMRYYKGKIPVYFRGDSTLLDEVEYFSIKKIIRRYFLRWVYSYVDHAFYVGSANKEYFLKHGLKESQLSFAPHAIDNKRFSLQSTLEEAQIRRKELGINFEDFVFLFAGKLEPKKNPELLLEVFRDLGQGNIHLVFAGNGDLEDSLKKSSEGVRNVHFIGFQNQKIMPTIYKMADVLVLPSVGPGETWGLAINEAMACGIPVIATDVCGGSSDLIRSGENGFIVKKGDRFTLRSAMEKMVNLSQEEKSKMGKNARKHIDNFTFEHIVNAVEKTVNEN